MTDFRINVEGMHCAGCVARVKTALSALEGTVSVECDLEKKTVDVRTSQPTAKLKEAIEKLGFDVKDINENNINC